MKPRSYSMADEERDWKAKGDLHTLIEARKIKKDQKRHKAAMDMARRQKEALADITTNPKPKE